MRVRQRHFHSFLFAAVLCTLSQIKAEEKKDFYKVLDVSRDADEATLKKAYKKLAYKWHPDRNPTSQEEASQKFMEIGEAYEVLSDPQKKAHYDQFGETNFGGGRQQTNFQKGGPKIFRWFFGDQEQNSEGFHFEFGNMGGGSGGRSNDFHHESRKRPKREPPSEDFYDTDPFVQVLKEDNFDEDTFGWIRVIEFYTPWCGHCRTLSPKWSSLGKALSGVVKVAAVNCDNSKPLCQRFDVTGYPSIRAFYAGSPLNGAEYGGERSSKNLQKWAVSLIPDYVTSVKKAKTLEEFLEKCGTRGRSRVTWKVCFLLFTEKTTTSALYKSLAYMYDGKVAFAAVQGNKDHSLEETYNVTAYPSIVAVCNGNAKTIEPFLKKMQPDRIRTFLNTFTAGRKCDKAVSIDSEKDVETLTTAQLKQILKEHGVDCEGCFEKSDYIRAVKSIYVTTATTT